MPIPMKQGEGVLYATGMGIAIYNFHRDDHSVYSEPGFALITPKAKAGMSIISKAQFQDVGFGYMAPPFASINPVFAGSTDYWFPHTWFPNFVPMVLDQAPAGMRTIGMYSNKLMRCSFTTNELYDERAQVSVLLEKLVTGGGRYAKYHPNTMLARFKHHYMLDIPELQPGQTSGEGLGESKTGDCSDSDDVDPSTLGKVVRNTFATPAKDSRERWCRTRQPSSEESPPFTKRSHITFSRPLNDTTVSVAPVLPTLPCVGMLASTYELWFPPMARPAIGTEALLPSSIRVLYRGSGCHEEPACPATS